MGISDIINKVRWCIDEETGYSDFEDTYMNNIIKAHLGDALRWCCMYGDSSLLSANSSSDDPGILKSYEITVGGDEDDDEMYDDGFITLPYNFLKLARVRCEGWHQSIKTPITEDSDEYLMLSDETASATLDRPQAALIECVPNKLELFPHPLNGDIISLTIVINPTDVASSATSLSVPEKASTAFIYYLAFLVLSAYNDTAKAQSMLGIAKMHLGQTISE